MKHYIPLVLNMIIIIILKQWIEPWMVVLMMLAVEYCSA